MHAGIYSQYSSHAPDVQYLELHCLDKSTHTHRGGPPVLHCSHATKTGASTVVVSFNSYHEFCLGLTREGELS